VPGVRPVNSGLSCQSPVPSLYCAPGMAVKVTPMAVTETAVGAAGAACSALATTDIFAEIASPVQYSTDGGASWTNVTENPFSVGDTAIAAGALQVRLKETYTHLAGEVLTSTAAFTENLTGSVSISGSAVYGEALTATVTGTQGDASPVYTWYRRICMGISIL